ncbi:MAG TPA: M14 family metallopeptidase [Steroidobacter sp.]|uniref:M14 family metallopeptidase n=1 Tax=Steroidobacter sp. TaxID=1978227 RepID=UPI002EDBAEBC
MSESPFSKHYSDARELFRSAATSAGAEVASYPYPAKGPGGEELTTDVAWIGPREAKKVFVTVSGTHGIEGFAGSAAQIDWLQRGEWKKLQFEGKFTDTSAILVHAINPYGFAWRRRVTHENIDLNRNWMDFAIKPERRADYDELADALCPTQWTAEVQKQTLEVLQAFIAKHNLSRFVTAVSGGQHDHPKGLFYGGTSPSAARLTLTKILAERLKLARDIGIIDFHTGLGPPGFGELMTTAAAGSAEFARAREWFGISVIPVGAAASASAAIGGDWLSYTPTLLPHARVTAIALEFGTVPEMLVLQALRADNWLHAHGNPNGPEAAAIREQITNAFHVDNDVWRGMVLGQALATSRAALTGLRQ